jgi:energy-coupling factor transport system permease protein
MKITFERFHPLVTFLYYLGSLSLMLLLLHPIFLGLGFMVILAINYLHDHLKGLRGWMLLILSTVVLIMIMNPIFNERGRHVLFLIGEHRITLESLVYGGMNAISIISVMTIFISYNYVMTPNKLLFLFSKILPQFAILLMLTLRFIPLMRRRLEDITLIQKSKGVSVTHGKWRTRARTGLLYVQALLTYSLEEAIQTADSMKARGYGEGRRSTYEYFKIGKKDILALFLLISIFAGIMTGRIYGYGVFTIYPVMEAWDMSTIDVILLFFYVLFLSFPLLVEAGEIIRWRLLN